MNLLGIRPGLLLAPLIAVAVVWPAHSETVIRKHVSYFSIFGRTVEDLDRQLLQRGPVSSTSGRRHPGATRISFTGTATFVGKTGKCEIGGANVALTTKLMLPRWVNRKRAGRALGLIWDTLSSDIKRHEERHAEIARYHARALEKSILSLSSASTCAALKTRVNRLSQAAIRTHDAEQQQFDRVEAANFESRMARLLKYRISANATE